MASGQATDRVAYLHMLRGLALLYIVFDHAVAIAFQVSAGASRATDMPVYHVLDNMSCGTRLPVLMFLAGLFLERSAAKGLSRFVAIRLRTLIWPLALWSIVQMCVLAAPIVPAENLLDGDLRHFLRHVWARSYQFWFLYALALYLAAFVVLRRVDRRLVLLGAAGLFVAAIVLAGYEQRSLMGTLTAVFGRLFLFFWLGHVLADWVLAGGARMRPEGLAACLAAFLLLAVPPVLADKAWWEQATLLSGLPAIPMMLWLAQRLPATPLAGLLDWAGRASMVIFCLHTMGIAGVVLPAHAAGVASPLVLALVSAVGSVCACYAADVGARRLGIAHWLGFQGGNDGAAARPRPLTTSVSA